MIRMYIMKNLGILLSGRGSNFEAIADNVASGKLDANDRGRHFEPGGCAGHRVGAAARAERRW